MTWEIVSSILPNILTRDIFFDLDLPFILDMAPVWLEIVRNLGSVLWADIFSFAGCPWFKVVDTMKLWRILSLGMEIPKDLKAADFA